MTILPPPSEERDTVPPEKARDSTLPPAKLDVPTLAIQLDALEAKVDEIRAETLGSSKSLHDIKNYLHRIADSYERLSLDVEIVRRHAQVAHAERAALRSDFNELERRVVALERTGHEVGNGKPNIG